MPKVHTTKGLIDRHLLTVNDIVSEDDNSRAVATEWFLDGELVRRDVHVMILRGHALGCEQAELA
jgi:hypothetical protein